MSKPKICPYCGIVIKGVIAQGGDYCMKCGSVLEECDIIKCPKCLKCGECLSCE